MENGRVEKSTGKHAVFEKSFKLSLWRVGGKVVSGCRGEGSVPRSPKRISFKKRVGAKVCTP